MRFNRLDRVDDVSEETSFGDVNLSKFLFVSCWTDEQEESVPQWKMYTTPSMRGVRISLPRPPFYFRPIDPEGYPIEVRGTGQTPIPFDQLITADYFILPTFVTDFEGQIEYLDDVAEKYKQMVRMEVSPDGKAALNITNMFVLGRFKNKRWSFQREVRYSIFVMPSLPLPPSGASDRAHFYAVVSSFVGNVVNGVAPRITHLDVELAPEAIDNLVVTLGPFASAGDRLIVEALLKEYTSAGKLLTSELTGSLREPIR